MGQNRKDGKVLAFCGLDCAACPALIAHKTDDQDLRAKTAAEWSRQFNVRLAAEDIDCVGCLKTEGVHVGHCAECEIRKCGLARGIKNCGLCPAYPCETIEAFVANVPPARANLEEIRRAPQ